MKLNQRKKPLRVCNRYVPPTFPSSFRLDELIQVIFTIIVVPLTVVLSTFALQVLRCVRVGEFETKGFRYQHTDVGVHPAVGR